MPEPFPQGNADEIALLWFVRLQGEPSRAERADFQRWFKASAVHRTAYQRVEGLWSNAAVPGARIAAEESAALRGYLGAMDRRKRGRKKAVAAVVSLFLVLSASTMLAIGSGVFQDVRADHVSRRGQREFVNLPDGSTVLLDADSSIADRFSEGERRIILLRGGAFFSVRPSAVPFLVESEKGTVRVVGTRFEVRLTRRDTLVTVEEGRVDIKLSSFPETTTVTAGQQARYTSLGAPSVQPVDLRDALAWRQGRLTFYQAPLSDVVQELERYHRGRIIVVGALNQRSVSGSLLLDDTGTALDALQSTVGFKKYSISPYLTILR